jgi:dihydroorotate dehydrogenase (fumarate)
MLDLTTTYMGIKLKNPIIASSSGLTNALSDIIDIEANGVSAIVLKSLFEEEIIMETQDNLNRMQASGFIYPETIEYFDFDEMGDPVADYLKLISDAKSEVKIPIIASINCITADKWPDFAKRIQEAGADGLELNIFSLSSDPGRTALENEQVYFDVIEKVTKLVTIPVSIKLSPYNASLSNLIKRLSETPIKAIVLFNRYYRPDFDIHNFEFTTTNVLSSSAEMALPLRWIAIMADRINCDLAASTGIHNGEGVVKQLLAGAKAVQVCSTLYRNGLGQIQIMLNDVQEWMGERGFKKIDDFRGKMSQVRSYNPAAFERVQFMQFFKEKGKPY